MDSEDETPSPESALPPKRKTTPFAGREDCWSAAATETLIEAWGERFLDQNRGSLRQKKWQEVADAVNSKHHNAGAAANHRRSDVQCKNRIDTLKKKYKIEKSKSKSKSSSPWQFFSRLDDLFGPSPRRLSPPTGRSRRISPPPATWTISSPIPVGRRSLTRKRPAESPAPARGMSAFLAAVEAMEREEASETQGGSAGDLVAAIERLGETYERVEKAKQRKMMELERQRMEFTKDLECQRMQLFMETQLHLQRIKRSKRASPPAATATTAPATADNYA